MCEGLLEIMKEGPSQKLTIGDGVSREKIWISWSQKLHGPT